MHQIAVLLRAMQLFTHNAHNLAHGQTFIQDHNFLGKLYPVYESAYDTVVERCIGLKGTCDLASITMEAAEGATHMDIATPFQSILEAEQMLCTGIQETLTSEQCSEGTKQMLGTLADESESRQYKLTQRTK